MATLGCRTSRGLQPVAPLQGDHRRRAAHHRGRRVAGVGGHARVAHPHALDAGRRVRALPEDGEPRALGELEAFDARELHLAEPRHRRAVHADVDGEQRRADRKRRARHHLVRHEDDDLVARARREHAEAHRRALVRGGQVR
ncbi:MAG: hypothetical protein M5U28_04920 [Sandaracinaceae bacterium]|nr:hypothetical protein [Sandaracinaceae bacterium]